MLWLILATKRSECLTFGLLFATMTCHLDKLFFKAFLFGLVS
jgi:hypothetical protein